MSWEARLLLLTLGFIVVGALVIPSAAATGSAHRTATSDGITSVCR